MRGKTSITVYDTIKEIEDEIRMLTTQKQNLSASNKDLETQRDKLLIEINTLTGKVDKTLKEAKEKSDEIGSIAEEKLRKINQRESESVEHQETLKNRLKDADNIVKSNEGFRRNLDLQISVVAEKMKKLNALGDLIKTSLKDI